MASTSGAAFPVVISIEGSHPSLRSGLAADVTFQFSTAAVADTFVLPLSAVVNDPDFAPFFVNNFNDSETDSQSVFAQWSTYQGDRWYFELGARYERFESETDEVDAFPARLVDMNPNMWPMGTPPRAVWIAALSPV